MKTLTLTKSIVAVAIAFLLLFGPVYTGPWGFTSGMSIISSFFDGLKYLQHLFDEGTYGSDMVVGLAALFCVILPFLTVFPKFNSEPKTLTKIYGALLILSVLQLILISLNDRIGIGLIIYVIVSALLLGSALLDLFLKKGQEK